MALIRPFPAIRPRPEFAADIAAVPYDVVSTPEARALAAGNPRSFLHVSRAEIDLPDGTDPYADEVYTRAWETFEAFRSSWLVQDADPGVYVYRLTMGDHTQTGVAATFSVEEYLDGRIARHEKTRRDKEDDRTRHISELRAQTGPVLLTYRQSDAIDAGVEAVTAGAPLYDFVAADGVGHTIWRAEVSAAEALVDAFGALSRLYIADGHHRAASAARAYATLGGEPDDPAAFFLAVAFPDVQMRILPYHRVVKDLHGNTPEAFLTLLSQRLPLVAGSAEPARKGECGVYVKGRWYTLTLDGPDGPADAAIASDPTSDLDASRLSDKVLAPLLGITDLRTDTRVDFVGGVRGTSELERLVDEGAAAVAFSMYPVTLDDLMRVADAGAIMPPKSTWFEPKLRDGLLGHEI